MHDDNLSDPMVQQFGRDSPDIDEPTVRLRGSYRQKLSRLMESEPEALVGSALEQEQKELPQSPSAADTSQLNSGSSSVLGSQERQQELPVSSPRSVKSLAALLLNPASSSNQKKKRIIVIGAIVCIIALLGASAFYVGHLFSAEPDITVYQVGLHTVTQSVGGGGAVFPLQQLDISYPVDERAIAVLVNPGDQVSPHQPLIQLDPSRLNAEITQAADDLLAAKVYLDNVSANGNALTIAQAQQAYDVAKNRYDALVAEAASPLLQNGNLVSPMSGVVTAVNISPGAVFAANTPLLTIVDESTVIVHAKMPLSSLGQIHVGQAATVSPSAFPNLTFQGTVSAIIPQVDAQTETFEGWIAVPNKDRMLLPGMSAFVRIQSLVKALVVPRLAVLDQDTEPAVFIVRNEHAYLQPVHIVGRSINAFFIDGGLSVGDKVVLVGSYKLQSGQKVRITKMER